MLRSLLGFLRALVAVALVFLALSPAGCAWVKSGERLDESTTVRDGQDEDQIDVGGLGQAEDSAPPINELP